MRLIANGSNILIERSEKAQLFQQRLDIGGDIRPSCIAMMHRQKPVETALFGNVQLGITPAVAITGNYYLETMFEGFYTKGAALPGIQQT